MSRQPFFHGSRPANDHFPNAVRVGDLIYTSGHVAMDEAGNVAAPGDCAAQADLIYQRLSELLEQAGSDMQNVVKITAFLTRADDYPEYNAARHRWFPENPPASSSVIVAELVRPGLVLEIEAVASVRTAN